MSKGRGRQSAAWQRFRRQVLATATHCGICGDALTDEKFPHPMSSELDHIVPLARGGALLDAANVQPAHRICNLKAGARRQRKRRRSRNW